MGGLYVGDVHTYTYVRVHALSGPILAHTFSSLALLAAGKVVFLVLIKNYQLSPPSPPVVDVVGASTSLTSRWARPGEILIANVRPFHPDRHRRHM